MDKIYKVDSRLSNDGRYHYLYQVTNKVNNKIYIGRHSTNNLNDGYIGSGVALNRAYKKYGKDKFIFEIIEFCDSIADVSDLERLIVNEDFVKRSDTYNLTLGGTGGCISHTEESKRKIGLASKGKKLSPEHKAKFVYNVPHTSEIREKIGAPQRGGLNNQARKLKCDGVVYDCVMDAARALGITRQALYKRMKSNKFAYVYCD